MKVYQVFLLSYVFAQPTAGHGIRGSFFDRVLGSDNGDLCVDNPVCVAHGITEGACCPNENKEYHSCCNRDCSAHLQCSQLAGSCCPSLDNVQLACCDHQPALDALSPTASPSQSPSASPSLNPSQGPSDFPSQTPSASPTQWPSDSPSQTPSASPTQWPSDSPSQTPSAMSSPVGCPSTSFQSVSQVQTLTTAGGGFLFTFDNLPSASSDTVTVEVFIRGDYDKVYEYAELRGRNNEIAKLDPNTECSVDYYSEVFIVSQASFNSWLMAGSVQFTIETTDSVGLFCDYNDAYITLCYEIPSEEPSQAPTPTPSDAPSSVPSQAPSLLPTIIEDRGDFSTGGYPVFIGGPMCQDNPKCAQLGLDGACCPTVDGVNLYCCSLIGGA